MALPAAASPPNTPTPLTPPPRQRGIHRSRGSVSPAPVRCHLPGVKRKRGGLSRPVSPTIKQKVVELKAEGKKQKSIAAQLGVSEGTVSNILKHVRCHGQDTAKLQRNPGRPGYLQAADLEALFEAALKAQVACDPWTHDEFEEQVRARVKERTGKLPSAAYISKVASMLCSQKRAAWRHARPLSEARANVNPEDVQQFKQKLLDAYKKYPHLALRPEYIFDFDEQELASRPEKASKVKTLVFPTALHDPNMYDPKGKITAVPYKRCLDAGERVTWAPLVSFDGSVVTSVYLFNGKVLQRDIFSQPMPVVLGGRDQRVYTNRIIPTARGVMTKDIFVDLMGTTIPDAIHTFLHKNGAPLNAGTPALLLADGCPSHHDPKIEQLLQAANIIFIRLPANSTARSQIQDRGLFGACKKLRNQVFRNLKSIYTHENLGFTSRITNPPRVVINPAPAYERARGLDSKPNKRTQASEDEYARSMKTECVVQHSHWLVCVCVFFPQPDTNRSWLLKQCIASITCFTTARSKLMRMASKRVSGRTTQSALTNGASPMESMVMYSPSLLMRTKLTLSGQWWRKVTFCHSNCLASPNLPNEKAMGAPLPPPPNPTAWMTLSLEPCNAHARREAATTTPRPRQSRNLTQLSVEVSNTLGNTRSRAVSSYAELQQAQQPHAAMAAAAASNSSQPTQPSASTPIASLVCDLNARFQQEQTNVLS
eukprot:m.413567 g.413567  ORF g.413567 m.413567 type:complete len:711 (-) comp20173_c2_seq11:613-2745(-)